MNSLMKTIRVTLLGILVLGLSAGAATAANSIQESGPLFEETTAPKASRLQTSPQTLRQRFVNVNLTTLEAARPGKTLPLNLFEDVVLQANIRSVERKGDATIWVADLEGIELGQAFVVSSQGQIALDVSMPQGLYQVRYASDSIHSIAQIDQSAYPEEVPPVEINLPATAPGESAGRTGENLLAGQADDGSVINILVGFTPAARDKAGGVTGIQNLINLAVAETNQSYLNSGVTQRINLVHLTEVAYTEAGNMGTDLTRLQSSGDGYLDDLHTLRNTYAADLVNLITESSQYCGIAYHMSTVSSAFESYAFSVVARDCATGYYSFAHELGHNMGARHDWYVDNNITPHTYAHGYVNTNAKWRTIMAYNNECTARYTSCTRLQYWANPNVLRGGAPMGVAGGTNTTCLLGDKNNPACDADDHRTLNDTAYTVANFRSSGSAIPTTTPQPTATLPPGPTATPQPTPTKTPPPTPVITAPFPFHDGFEQGVLDKNRGWNTHTTGTGRVQVSKLAPYAGAYSVLLDDGNGDENNSLAALVITTNLARSGDARLSFHWRSYDDEAHPEDGVFISDNYGASWAKVFSFSNGPKSYQQVVLKLGTLAADHKMRLNDHFQVKFQFYDNYSIPNDGYSIDEVSFMEAEPFWQARHFYLLPLIRSR